MKRVLIFSLRYHPYVGGAEVAVKELTDRIHPKDIEFHMVTLRHDSALPTVEQVGNILVHRIGPHKRHPSIKDLNRFPLKYDKYLYQLLAAATAARLHRQYRYDAIWAMMAHATGIPAGIFKATHPQVPYLLTLQEGDPPEYIERLARPVWPLFTQGFTKADHVQAISTSLLAWAKRMGAPEGSVIPNGVDIARFTQRDTARAHTGVRLVTTSRLVHKNGIDTVIRALPLLPAHVSFLIYGVGEEEGALKQLAAELRVSERTQFMGQVDHEQLPQALAACDIFVRPSRSEGMGNSFIEAMAVGLPVIATQEGGIADFLFDAQRDPDKETTGWAVDPDAPEQIAEAVNDILAHPEAVARVTNTARALVRTTYDWNTIAGDMHRLILRLTA